MSRASFLFWTSAVRWCRASCKTLGATTKKGSQRKGKTTHIIFTSQSSIPQLLEGFVNMLLQNLLHSFSQLHFFFQLLIYRVNDELVPSPSIPQCQAFVTDLQGNGGHSQSLLSLLLRLIITYIQVTQYGSYLHISVVLSYNTLKNIKHQKNKTLWA